MDQHSPGFLDFDHVGQVFEPDEPLFVRVSGRTDQRAT